MGFLRRLHIAILAWWIKFYRTRELVKKFQVAHAEELRGLPFHEYPVVRAKQQHELAAVRAGKLDSIVDRKSWQWPFMPSSIQRLSQPLLKATPYNLRRLSRTPVPRRAINLVKNAIISLSWDILPLDDVSSSVNTSDQEDRIRAAKKVFRHPNNEDSMQTFVEQGIEDMCCFGAFVAELGLTLDVNRPLKTWVVNVESVRVFPTWTESTPDMPRYAQMTGLKGERGAILFYNDELMYIKDNPATDTPFGMGRMEIAFSSISDFIGVQNMAGRAGTDQVHKTWLWWEQPQSESSYQIVRRHIQNELEGQAKVSIIGGMKKPDILEITPVTEADLLLQWQEMLIRMIANAFDMSPLALGIERDVNRSTGEILDDKDFRSAVVPLAKRLQEAFTRKLLHECLGWYDLEFRYTNLDDPSKQTTMDIMARMYSANACTPNQIRAKMGEKKLDTPFADLTQFEAMLINTEAAAEIQNKSAEQASKRQEDAQQRQAALAPLPGADPTVGGPFPPAPGQQLPGAGPGSTPGQSKGGFGAPKAGGFGAPGGAGGAGAGKGVAAPKKISLPKFPISGSRYNATQIASMPINQLSDLINSGQLPKPSVLLRDMKSQDPSILDQMSEEVRQYLEQAEDKEKTPKRRPVPDKARQKEQVARFRKRDKRTSDMSQYLQEIGRKVPRGTTNQGLRPVGGRPGNVNPLNRV